VIDNYGARKRVEFRDWLAAIPRTEVCFTPTSASWMNMVEFWFRIIERQAFHHGTFGGVHDLTARICTVIDGWNDEAIASSGPKPPIRSSPSLSVQQ